MKKYIKPELKTLNLDIEQLMDETSLPVVPKDPDFIDMTDQGMFDADDGIIHTTSVWDE